MAVVINEFEVVPGETPPPPKTGGAEAASNQEGPSEHEIGRLVQHGISREERVWAH